jgi:hypothetical protein
MPKVCPADCSSSSTFIICQIRDGTLERIEESETQVKTWHSGEWVDSSVSKSSSPWWKAGCGFVPLRLWTFENQAELGTSWTNKFPFPSGGIPWMRAKLRTVLKKSDRSNKSTKIFLLAWSLCHEDRTSRKACHLGYGWCRTMKVDMRMDVDKYKGLYPAEMMPWWMRLLSVCVAFCILHFAFSLCSI